MPGYLLDTNVISELARPKPDDGVLDFKDSGIKVLNSFGL